MSVKVKFKSIKVEGMETNAGIFIGKTSASGWDSHSKNQMAVGPMTGSHNVVTDNYIYMPDNDQIDTPIIDNDDESSSKKVISKKDEDHPVKNIPPKQVRTITF